MDAIKKVVRSIQKGETIGIRTVSKTKEEIVAELLARESDEVKKTICVIK
jgi:hypothetical protein